MFKLTEQDLRVAKPLPNIFMASIVLVGIAFGTSNLELLGLLQGFFPILALIVLYYSLKVPIYQVLASIIQTQQHFSMEL